MLCITCIFGYTRNSFSTEKIRLFMLADVSIRKYMHIHVITQLFSTVYKQ